MKRRIMGLVAVSLLMMPLMAAAQPEPEVGQTITPGQIYQYVATLLKYAFGLAFAVCVIFIVWGAVEWASAGGDDEKMKSARKKLINGVLGAAIIIGVLVLINLVANYFFGVTTSGFIL